MYIHLSDLYMNINLPLRLRFLKMESYREDIDFKIINL